MKNEAYSLYSYKVAELVSTLYQQGIKKLLRVVDRRCAMDYGLLVCAVSSGSVKQHFCNKNHQQADGRSGPYFTYEINEIAKLEPLD
jgi:hypothetical protein